MKIKRVLGKKLYRAIAIHMPMSFSRFNLGSRRFRQACAHMMLEDCGKWVNIEKGAMFGEGLKIGNGSGIGAYSSIPGVHVGDGAVIGAGAVVTKDVPPYEIWGGNPARFLKSRLSG